MKLVSYLTRGRPAFGVVNGEGIVTLSGRLGALDLKGLLAQQGIAHARELASGRDADIPTR